MSPLSMIEYIVERLKGTVYEPWVNMLLFMLFAVAVIAAIRVLLGKSGRKLLSGMISAARDELEKRRGYSPEVEGFRLRILPYMECIWSLYLAFVGLYSATLVVLILMQARKFPVLPLLVCGAWIVASLLFTRFNLEAASWAYHKVKAKGNHS